VLSRTNASTVANTLSGSGTIVKSGGGRLSVTGSNAAGPLNWSFNGIGNGDVGFTNAAALGGAGSTITVGASGSGSVFLSTGSNTTDVAISIGTGGTFTWNGSTANTNTLSGPISGAGTFNKVSGETLILTGTSPLTGPITVTTGRLILNGALPNTSGVSVAGGAFFELNGLLGGTSGYVVPAGSIFKGSGSLAGTLGGAGLVSPGSSPGILAVGAVDPSANLAFEFEFTGTGSPAYGTATASTNDVLRLTGGTPFTAALSPANAVDVYLQLATVTAGDVFRGGFYADSTTAFSPSIDNATFNVWVLGNGSGTSTSFNGQNYYSLAAYDPAFTVIRSTVADTATFADGTVNGGVTQWTIVPEPSMLALGAAGAALAGAMLRRRAGRRG
jgi:fibronectin-binding autotransporter adhesin